MGWVHRYHCPMGMELGAAWELCQVQIVRRSSMKKQYLLSTNRNFKKTDASTHWGLRFAGYRH